MSWITRGKRNERKEYAETVNEEKQQEQRISPLDAVNTTHAYRIVQERSMPDCWLTFETVALDVKYRPATGAVELTLQNESVTLDKEEFEDLRRVLRAFAHDPNFNEGTEELA